MDVVRALLRAMKGVDLRLNTKVVSICEGPSAEGIYFSGLRPKNQFSPAIATPARNIKNYNEGPSAEGIYFSGGRPKNQIPSAIATPARACHSEPSSCHSEPSSCHSERSEESMGYLVNGEPFDAVVVTTGGAQRFPFLEGLGLEIVEPVPSLFTFNVPDKGLRALMGLVVEAQVGLLGTAFKAEGPLLITDWGLSGP
ncbi:MAG: NAD(P)/FAD-dependent oxidoreductase, partial [Bacteroidales bacterium]|nr:NAD(P)/FAD-dependent oxidoreductase [Bacteroidales bacterium]